MDCGELSFLDLKFGIFLSVWLAGEAVSALGDEAIE